MPAPKGHAPYPGCETGGRPKKYTKEFIDLEADALLKWMENKDNLFIELFAFERGYDDSRISEFKKVSDKFADACNLFFTRQKGILYKGGLTRKYAHPMCALILSHMHNVHQKTEQKITGDMLNPLHCVLGGIDGATKELVSNSDGN